MQQRNYVGIQLIDRNDELCILYEKANVQEAKLKEAEVEYRMREQVTLNLVCFGPESGFLNGMVTGNSHVAVDSS